jgi:hypothetical protein
VPDHWLQERTGNLQAQHRHLAAKHHDLKGEIVALQATESEHLEDADDRYVEERHGHLALTARATPMKARGVDGILGTNRLTVRCRPMAKTRSPEERLLGIGHIRYEVEMMVESAKRLQDARDDWGPERNVLVEVTLVHARNLIEFLGDRNKRKDEMSPNDFAPGWDFDSCKHLMQQLGPINENLTH